MRSFKYLDCELYLTGYDQAKLTVGGRDYSGRPALDEALERRLLQAALDPIQYGTFLFEALFPSAGDDLLAGYREALAIAQHEEKRLRLRLYVATTAPPKLQDLHWEFLYDAKKKIALGRSRDTAFSRYLSVDREPPAAVAEKPRLLVVVSSPRNLAEYHLAALDPEEMRQSIECGLSALKPLVSCEFLEGPATASRIRDRLVAGRFHALHLLGHGLLRSDRAAASLVLEGEDGRAVLTEEDRFAEIFEGERELRLVVLLACHGGVPTTVDPFSGLGPSLVARGIPAVVAMRRAISVDAAARFTDHFYRNLARSGHVDAAVNEARQQLHLADGEDLEWGTPALYMRLPDGCLWQGAPEPEEARKPRPSAAEAEIWDGLLPWIESDDFIPILGPGLNRGLLPSGEEIAEIWAAKYGYPLNLRPNLPRVAQYLETKVGRNIPHQRLPRLLTEDLLEREQIHDKRPLMRQGLSQVIEKVAFRYFDRDDNAPHRILAELPVSTYVTSNYDSFMTAALRWKGREPVRRACLWKEDLGDLSSIEEYDDLEGTPQKPLVFHLFGNDLEPTSQVLTEDDHLDYLGFIAKEYRTKIPSELRAGLSGSMLLFLGYNIHDLDCRVLFRGLVAQLGDPQRERLAVLQVEGDQGDEKKRAAVQLFMQKTCENLRIHVYWGSVREFLSELRRQWSKEYGDL
ncbi:MAG: CHAT domain-containing protein [bacterium]|nr:CHAT domain-containing protein [bacterium]